MHRQFLNDLWETKTDGHILIWAYDGDRKKESKWCRTADEAAALLDKVAARNINIYVGVGLAPRAYEAYERCLKKDIAGIGGLWLDMDVKSPHHAKDDLPGTIEEALELLAEFPQEPTYIINSGHGLQAWWLFKEVWEFDSPTERADAEQLEKRLNYHFKALAKNHGWDVDSIFNLDRVLRIPGTQNCKGTPVPVTVVKRDESKRYNPSDFEWLPEISPEQDAPTQATAGDLQLNAGAEPPFDKFNSVVDIEPRFKLSWEKQRSDFQDQSASTYDLSLARFAYMYGWKDQEVANLLIAFRRKHNEDLKLRQDYYQRTLAFAKRGAERNKAAEDIASYVGAQSPDEAALITPEQKEANLQSLSSLFGVRIIQIIKFIADPPEFKLKTVRGDITLGTVDGLIGQAKLRSSVAAATGKYIQKFKPDKWDNIAQVLLDCCYEVEIGDEATERGEVTGWLQQYLDSYKPMDEEDMQEAITQQLPFKYKGAIALFGAHFRKWVRVTQQEKLSTRKMGVMLRAAGCGYQILNVELGGKNTTRSVWVYREDDDHAEE